MHARLASNINSLPASRFGAFNAAGQQTAPPFNSLGQPLRIEYGNSVTDTFAYYDQHESWQKHFRIKTTRTADRNGVEYFRNDYGFLDGQGQLTNNITSLLDPRFGDQSFGYDYLNRLASATQSAPAAPDAFRQSNGSLWAGYGVHTWSYAKNGNITARTELSPLGVLDSFAYAYAGAQPHAVTGIVKNGGLVWGATYNQNGALLAKGSDLDPSAPKDHDYLYDAYDRLVAALDVSGLRLSDSFYHLGGARLFEGRLTQTGQVEGSLVINGGYELKLSSGNPVYTVKHIRVGGRAIGDVYEKITDWNSRGLGCGSLAGRAEIASPLQIVISLSVLSVPLCLILLLSFRVFSGPGFHAHPYRNTFILLLLAVLAWELSPGSLLDFRAANPMHKQALYRTLKKLLPIVYGSATIPQSRLTAEFFDNLKAAAKAGKILGPRAAQAQADEREVLYYHSDHLGSTRLITLQSGEVYQYLNYLPFGKALEGFQQSSYILPGWAQSKRSFTGQEIDRTTGLMFYQSRFYDPEIGRFIQPDDAVGGNRYAYVLNNPLKFSDPTGHSWVSEIGEAYNQIGNAVIEATKNFLTMVQIAPALGGMVGGLPGLAITALVMVGAAVQFAGALFQAAVAYIALTGMVLFTIAAIIGTYIGPLAEAYVLSGGAQASTAEGDTQGTETPAEDPAAESDVAAGGSQADASAGGTPTEASPAGGSAPSTSLEGYTGGVSTEGPLQSTDPFPGSGTDGPTVSTEPVQSHGGPVNPPPADAPAVDYIFRVADTTLGWYSKRLINQNEDTINKAAGAENIRPSLIKAAIFEEQTHLNPPVVEDWWPRGNTVGLGQQTAGNHGLTRKELLVDETNIYATARSLGNITRAGGPDLTVEQIGTRYNNARNMGVSQYGVRFGNYVRMFEGE